MIAATAANSALASCTWRTSKVRVGASVALQV
jgi:hypothetical protein